MENDKLANYLNSISSNDDYRIEETLKNTDLETTEVVYFLGASGSELGPFIRKRIKVNANIGSVYKEIYEAQNSGIRFLHLPRIQNVFQQGDELVVIMEFVRGDTIADHVQKHGVSLDLVNDIFPKLCDGVRELHEGLHVPVIHRDLKPSNVIINGQNLTIIDFGISRTYKEDATTDTSHLGTRAYAPPEQFGYGQTDTRSDVYAMGLILYYLLTGKDPNQFTVVNRFEEVSQSPLRDVLIKATSFDPKMRYQSVLELKNAYMQAIVTVSAKPAIVTGNANCVMPNGLTNTITNGYAAPNHEKPSSNIVIANTQASGASSTADKTKASSSEIVGLVWDCIVGIVGVAILIACLVAPFTPTNNMSEYPFWFLLVEFWIGAVLIIVAGIYALLDKRWLRRKIPFLRSQTYGKSLVVALLIFLVGFLVFCFLAIVLMATNSFGTNV